MPVEHDSRRRSPQEALQRAFADLDRMPESSRARMGDKESPEREMRRSLGAQNEAGGTGVYGKPTSRPHCACAADTFQRDHELGLRARERPCRAQEAAATY
jgi:hypothetical protein